MVEVIRARAGTLVCCKQPMNLLVENTRDASKEKHVPVVEKVEGRIKVKIGAVAHPMTEEHHIEWIEAIIDGRATRQYLKPGGAPEATFCASGENIVVREFCNLHGLWKA
jgi:superoxide reductase